MVYDFHIVRQSVKVDGHGQQCTRNMTFADGVQVVAGDPV